jgi:ketosteroid isomerase-like protein
MVEQGALMRAFERYYAEDVVLQLHDDPPARGKEAARAALWGWFSQAVTVVAKLSEPAKILDPEAGTTESVWSYDLGLEGGKHLRLGRAVWRRWEGGLVVEERCRRLERAP